MASKRWLWLGIAMFVALSGMGMADGHGHNKHDRDDDDDQGEHYYREHERGEMRNWYHDHGEDLPPGLARRDRLPPGLERQLRVRGELPPGLRKKMLPCPEDLERRLPPPPLGCAHVVVGGHVVLVNRSSYMVLDIFHFER